MGMLASHSLLLGACGGDPGGNSSETLGAAQSAIHSGTIAQDSDQFPGSTVTVNNGSCTGTIIGPRHVLTARHCNVKAGDTIGYFSGGVRSGQGARVMSVYHENTRDITNTGPDDWAVLYLDSIIPADHKPAMLGAVVPADGTTTWHVGAGQHDDGATPGGTSLRYRQTTMSLSFDWEGWLTTPPLGDHGDSGGPLFTYDNGNDVEGGAGLIVHGVDYGRAPDTGLFTPTWSNLERILQATGLARRVGLVVGGTVNRQLAATLPECAALCRANSSCSAYSAKLGTCQMFTGPVTTSLWPTLAGAPASAVKQPKAQCATTYDRRRGTGPACQFPLGESLDYNFCANEGETCKFGGLKYVAYGANDYFVYKALVGNPNDYPKCEVATFGKDPLPGVNKRCWYSNYAFQVNEYAPAPAVTGEVAFGANGLFNFKQINGAYRCDTSTFGDPAPGLQKACYLALPEYSRVASEGQSLDGWQGIAAAFGANGHYSFQVLSGQPSCDLATFSGDDPAPNVAKSCYIVSAGLALDEGQSAGSTRGFSMAYGSGLNGNFLLSNTVKDISCTNAFFGGDPDPGRPKHCWWN